MPNVHMHKDNPLRGKKSGKWTKWGGYIHGLVKETTNTPWYCQACGGENPPEFKPFLYEIYNGDFVRMCNSCYATAIRDSLGVCEEDKVIILRRTIKLTRHHRSD